MADLWTWGGVYIGRREDDALWTHHGEHVGHFQKDDIYASSGRYLGEILSPSRLITNRSKKHLSRSSFSPHTSKPAWDAPTSYLGNMMYAGYEDFPSLAELEV